MAAPSEALLAFEVACDARGGACLRLGMHLRVQKVEDMQASLTSACA